MIKILLQEPPHKLRNLKRNSKNQLHVLEQITQVKKRSVTLVKTNQHFCQKQLLESK
jgi:hypothetical protein